MGMFEGSPDGWTIEETLLSEIAAPMFQFVQSVWTNHKLSILTSTKCITEDSTDHSQRPVTTAEQ